MMTMLHMPNRSVNVSVRMSAAEAEALAAADIPGAATPSEKLRALVDDLAERERARTDFAAAAEAVERMFAPARSALRAATGPGAKSDVFAVLFERLPDTVARLAIATRRLEEGEGADTVERDAVSDIAALVDELTHVARAADPRALDATALRRALRIGEDENDG